MVVERCMNALYSRVRRLSIISAFGSLTKLRGLSENARDEHSAEPCTVFHHGLAGRHSRSALHVVQNPHEKTPRRERPVHPLHLPQMHLPAHHEAHRDPVGIVVPTILQITWSLAPGEEPRFPTIRDPTTLALSHPLPRRNLSATPTVIHRKQKDLFGTRSAGQRFEPPNQ